ncbi:ATP synthase F0 subunit 8 (mitochondrion) [Branchiostoma lanceolatum]|uniref:ATP synthase F(0) complex subunit 8 n=2 Tax=Branchiostoma TaxID=7737 RepID=ATP8_BRALA|nr:ATP synthase F0 subunit 8 [Branchiostoma lanceolatum]O21003.2 RecName: Full=ATP synthase protein 8; AltName: Full=A6L; AltName: Full=F-ATPase subunit 8 [Branchiostoma lanceolatum]BAH86331.1 ATP synthase F0 subunit 8 [Branchiostoma floridae]CAA76251.1 ATPase 8 [Branchiostoma lanceolatum]BAH86344.1 ATP synthase F0 subunit 8 [Branchiostoma floridae]BAH86357.1 ATP synthase F0 subunit 8 [Branchiostoma floridae]BAH86370.1 ATP synthase F0 subunit 8 [Branchiostoma floridae]
MPQLNPIPWVFLFFLVWLVLGFLGLQKFTSVVTTTLDDSSEEVEVKSKEYSWPW